MKYVAELPVRDFHSECKIKARSWGEIVETKQPESKYEKLCLWFWNMLRSRHAPEISFCASSIAKTDCRNRYCWKCYWWEDNHFKQNHTSYLASDKRPNQMWRVSRQNNSISTHWGRRRSKPVTGIVLLSAQKGPTHWLMLLLSQKSSNIKKKIKKFLNCVQTSV